MKTDILKPRANVRNIVGQELPALFGCMLLAFANPVACCWDLLRKVWNRSDFKLRENVLNIVGQQLPTLRVAGHQCWVRLQGLKLVLAATKVVQERHDLVFVRLFNLVYVLGRWGQKELRRESMDRWVKTSRREVETKFFKGKKS